MERFFSGLVPNSKLEMSGWFKVQVNYKSRCRFLVVRNWYSITPMNIASYLGWSKLKALVKQGWELRSESFHESFLNSHVPVKQEQELHESWWELRSESFHESFLNSPVPLKQEQELHKSWLDITARLQKLSVINSHENLNQFKMFMFHAKTCQTNLYTVTYTISTTLGLVRSYDTMSEK